MIYGAGIRTLTERNIRKLREARKGMERIMLSITRGIGKRTNCIRKETGLELIGMIVMKIK